MSSEQLVQAFERSLAIRTGSLGEALHNTDFGAASLAVQGVIDAAKPLSDAPELARHEVAREALTGVQSHLLSASAAVNSSDIEATTSAWEELLRFVPEAHSRLNFLAQDEKPNATVALQEATVNIEKLISMLPIA